MLLFRNYGHSQVFWLFLYRTQPSNNILIPFVAFTTPKLEKHRICVPMLGIFWLKRQWWTLGSLKFRRAQYPRTGSSLYICADATALKELVSTLMSALIEIR